MDYGIQLYSIGDKMEADMDSALGLVSALGYKSVEFAGFFGKSPEEISFLLEKHGLELSGTHTWLSELEQDFKGTVRFHRAIGNKNIIIPGADLSTHGQLEDFISDVNRYGALLADEGINLGYHNHLTEFSPNSDGDSVFTRIVEDTGLRIELDTCLAWLGGADPIALMKELKDRIDFIHIKDSTPDCGYCALGLGSADLRGVHALASEYGIRMIVENSPHENDTGDDACICMEYLRALDSEE